MTTPPPHSDAATFASETNSTTAAPWARGLLSSPRTAADLVGAPLDLVEDLVASGRIRTERIHGQRRVRVDDVLAELGVRS